MTTTVPERVPLGASTLNRKFYLDIDTAVDPATPSWTGVFGITEFQDALDTTLQDDSDFDSEGYGSQTATKIDWSLTLKLARKTTASDASSYDPGQEALRLAAGELGEQNRVHVRWYEMNGDTGPQVEAYEGYAAVSWSPDGGAMDALSTVSVTLTGKGKRIAIAHPAAPAV